MPWRFVHHVRASRYIRLIAAVTGVIVAFSSAWWWHGALRANPGFGGGYTVYGWGDWRSGLREGTLILYRHSPYRSRPATFDFWWPETISHPGGLRLGIRAWSSPIEYGLHLPLWVPTVAGAAMVAWGWSGWRRRGVPFERGRRRRWKWATITLLTVAISLIVLTWSHVTYACSTRVGVAFSKGCLVVDWGDAAPTVQIPPVIPLVITFTSSIDGPIKRHQAYLPFAWTMVPLMGGAMWTCLIARRNSPIGCVRCGYNLQGISPDSPCPECGTTRNTREKPAT